MKKSELVERMYTTRLEFEELLATLTPDQMTQSGVADEWSVKDMLAHIAWYQQEEAELFGETGVPESPLWAVPQEPRNALLFEQNQHKSLDEVLTAFRQAFEGLAAAVSRLSDAELNTPGRFPGTTAERPPWKAIAIHSYEHDHEHIDMIQAWLARLQDDN